MISDDPDAAIEALSDAARLTSPEAVETYLALGDLFKREGDLTRAIRLHRNMLHRPGLPAPAAAPRWSGSSPTTTGGPACWWTRPRPTAGSWRRRRARRRRPPRRARRPEAPRRGGGDPADPLQPDARLLAHLLAARSREARERRRRPRRGRGAGGGGGRSGCADAQVALAEALAGPGTARAPGALDRGSRRRRRRRSSPGRRCASSRRTRPQRWSTGRSGRARATRGCSPCAAGRSPGGRPAQALAPLREALAADPDGEVTLVLRELLRGAAPPGPAELAGRHDLMAAALLRSAGLLRCGAAGAGRRSGPGAAPAAGPSTPTVCSRPGRGTRLPGTPARV